jgi:O-antigen ligase
VFFATATLFTFIGLSNGASIGSAFRDVRGPLIFCCVVIMILFALRFDLTNTLKYGVGGIKLLVFWSACAAILGVAGLGGWLNGRFTAASLYGVGSAGESELSRQLLSSGRLLVAVLCFYIIYYCRRPGLKIGISGYAVAISASVALLLTFSRNHLITVLVALLVSGVFVANRLGATLRAAQMIAVVGGFVVVLGIVAGTLSNRFQLLLSDVSRTFRTRVIEGLDPSVVNVESSAEWRDIESGLAWLSMMSRFWSGTGFGAPYRGYAPGEVFNGTYGLTYLHNSFLWVPVKVGVPLALALLALSLALFFKVWGATAARYKDSVGRDAMLVLLALAPAMYVAPTLFSTEGAPVLGGLIAVALFSMKARDCRWWSASPSPLHDSTSSAVGGHGPLRGPDIRTTSGLARPRVEGTTA